MTMFSGIEFAQAYFLVLLIVVPIVVVWYIFRKNMSYPTLNYSTAIPFKLNKNKHRGIFRHVLFGIKMLALIAFIFALARPQSTNKWQDVTTEGIDIVISLDISGSMLAEDFKPNRIEASKDVAAEFINSRPNDNIGLVIFSGTSFTQCPLTTDHASLLNLFKAVETGMIEDGTAIGEGLATSVNRLKDSKAKSKVIILLTDGVNNMGMIDPYTAAEIAHNFGIRIYTIGVGTIGKAPFPFKTPFGVQYQNVDVDIDEPLLKHIAKLTGGKYFRATDKNKLREIYKEIDQMEKTKISVREYRKKKEEFFPYLLAGVALALLGFILKYLFFRYLP